jgi:lysophospholipase L1-like esterase
MSGIRLSRVCAAIGALLYFGLLAYWAPKLSYDTATAGFVALLVIVAAIGAGCLVSIAMSHRWRVGIVLVAVWLGVLVYSAEAILVVTFLTRPMPDQANDGIWDDRSLHKVVGDLRASGTLAVPDISSGQLSAYASSHRPTPKNMWFLGGIALHTTVLCNEYGAWVVHETDQHGFTNPRDIWLAEEIDVAILGDSQMKGYCVPAARGTAAVVRGEVPATISLGNGSIGPLRMLAILKEFLPALHPKHVFWVYYEGNDHTNLTAELDSPLLRQYLQSGFTQGIEPEKELIDDVLLDYVDEWLNTPRAESPTRANIIYRLTNLIHLARLRRYLDVLPPEPFETVAMSRILEEARSVVVAWGGTLTFVYLPAVSRYGPWAGLAGNNARIQAWVTAIAEEKGLPIVDLHARFEQMERPERLYNGHLSTAGHRAVGEAIIEAIRERNREATSH